MVVYLALGVTGEPSSPNIITIPPLMSMAGFSNEFDWRTTKEKNDGITKSNISYICEINKIDEWCLPLDAVKVPWLEFT